MNLDRLVKEVRPTGGVCVLTGGVYAVPVHALPTLVVAEDARLLAAAADVLAYGSALLLTGGEGWEALEAEIVPKHWRDWHGAPGVPTGSRCWVKSYYDGATYSTHVPYLLEAARRTEGPILELGSGNGSTLALHALAEQGRLVVTVDSDEKWLAKFAHLASPTHLFELLADPAETRHLDAGQRWGVVFVDHSPGNSRRRAVERARSIADFIVVHDSEELGYGLEDLLSSFRQRVDHRRSRPWTTVVSDTRDVWS